MKTFLKWTLAFPVNVKHVIVCSELFHQVYYAKAATEVLYKISSS